MYQQLLEDMLAKKLENMIFCSRCSKMCLQLLKNAREDIADIMGDSSKEVLAVAENVPVVARRCAPNCSKMRWRMLLTWWAITQTNASSCWYMCWFLKLLVSQSEHIASLWRQVVVGRGALSLDTLSTHSTRGKLLLSWNLCTAF